MSLLHVTWDGPGAVYLRSLYFPIFARLGVPVRVLQLTYGEREEVEATRRLAQELGIDYQAHRFERRGSPWRTIAAEGGRLIGEALRNVWSDRTTVVMARSLVPAAAVMLAGVPRQRFVFDADGFPADERVEFGGWKSEGLPYRAATAVERAALRRAGVTVTRTTTARAILLERSRGAANVLVARNGSDEDRFRLLTPEARAVGREALGVGERDLLVVYAGSLGPQYHPSAMATFARHLAKQYDRGRVHLLVLTGATAIAEELVRDAGLPSECSHVRRVDPTEVPGYLGLADLALAFREPSLSQRGVSPIKVGEYLLCGVPVVTNEGVGDLDQVLTDESAIVIDRIETAQLHAAAVAAATTRFARERIRTLAEPNFGLAGAVRGYRAAIDAVGSSR